MDADFWWLLTVASLVWYSSITIYITIRGVLDIKNMHARLAKLNEEHELPQE
jgi:hypothetical protein